MEINEKQTPCFKPGIVYSQSPIGRQNKYHLAAVARQGQKKISGLFNVVDPVWRTKDEVFYLRNKNQLSIFNVTSGESFLLRILFPLQKHFSLDQCLLNVMRENIKPLQPPEYFLQSTNIKRNNIVYKEIKKKKQKNKIIMSSRGKSEQMCSKN